MRTVSKDIDAIVVGFVQSILFVILLFLSLFGIIVVMIGHEVLMIGVRMIAEMLSQTLPTKMDNYLYFIMFIVLWVFLGIRRYQGKSFPLELGFTSSDIDVEVGPNAGRKRTRKPRAKTTTTVSGNGESSSEEPSSPVEPLKANPQN